MVATKYLIDAYKVLIYCNMAVKGLTDVYTWFPRAQRLKKSLDMSVKPQACLCYDIYVALSIVAYSMAHNYHSITMLQVKC